MMQCLRRLVLFSSSSPALLPPSARRALSSRRTPGPPAFSGGDDEWDDAWESAWLPDDLSPQKRAPWEADVHFPDSTRRPPVVLPSDADPETKAFVEDMDERWDERRTAAVKSRREQQQQPRGSLGHSGEQVGKECVRDRDEEYRLEKQRIHAGLWVKEIERMEESKLGDLDASAGTADIDRLLDSCAEIFDSRHNELNNARIFSTSDFKTKPEGWEETSKASDGNIWEVTQREEDILLQEFERRIAYSKFQIASFIKTHIFSRRRPIDGWKYMIEELGPNARKGKGSVQRLPALADPSTQPFKEDIASARSKFPPSRER